MSNFYNIEEQVAFFLTKTTDIALVEAEKDLLSTTFLLSILLKLSKQRIMPYGARILCLQHSERLAQNTYKSARSFLANYSELSIICNVQSEKLTRAEDSELQVECVDFPTFFSKKCYSGLSSQYSIFVLDFDEVAPWDLLFICQLMKFNFSAWTKSLNIVFVARAHQAQLIQEIFGERLSSISLYGRYWPTFARYLNESCSDYRTTSLKTLETIVRTERLPKSILIWVNDKSELKFYISNFPAISKHCDIDVIIVHNEMTLQQVYSSSTSSNISKHTVTLALEAFLHRLPIGNFDYVIDSGFKRCINFGLGSILNLEKRAIYDVESEVRGIFASAKAGGILRLYRETTQDRKNSLCGEISCLSLLNIFCSLPSNRSLQENIQHAVLFFGCSKSLHASLLELYILEFLNSSNNHLLFKLGILLQWDNMAMLKSLHVAIKEDYFPNLTLLVGCVLHICDGNITYLSTTNDISQDFVATEGEFLTCLNIILAFKQARASEQNHRDDYLAKDFCRQYNLKYELLDRALRTFFVTSDRIEEELDIRIGPIEIDMLVENKLKVQQLFEKAIIGGFFLQLVQLENPGDREYRLCIPRSQSESRKFTLSANVVKKYCNNFGSFEYPKYVVYYKAVRTTKTTIHGFMKISNIGNLKEVVPKYFAKFTNSNPNENFYRKKDLSKY